MASRKNKRQPREAKSTTPHPGDRVSGAFGWRRCLGAGKTKWLAGLVVIVGIFCFAIKVWHSHGNRQAANPLTWVAGKGCQEAAVSPEPGGKPGFTLMPPSVTGVWFTNLLQGDAYLTNLVAHNGSGVAIGDVDGDGWQDIYLCNLQGPNRLYRNLGHFQFEEMPLGEAACLGQSSTGAVFADVDGDGDLDLLVNGIGVGTRLFLNDGKGRWTEKKDSGLSATASATSLALADIDGDGDLDLYCTHYVDAVLLADPTIQLAMAQQNGRIVVSKINGQPIETTRWKDRLQVLPDGSVNEVPEIDGFYRNDGHGHFTPIQSEPGVFLDEDGKPIPPFRDWGLGVMFRDINGDGAPDIFVCNDNASPDRFWINSGKGTFRLIEPMAMRHASRSSMGVDFADLNRDGHDDFLVLDMFAREHVKRMSQLARSYPDPAARERIGERQLYNRNTLFMGRSDGSFAEMALMAGIAATDWSWCPIFLDVDLDGYEDLLISTGFEMDVMDQDSTDQFRKRKWTPEQVKRFRQYHPNWRTTIAGFRNRGDGTFENRSQAWGFDRPGIAQGMALGDLDNDGDLDLVVNNLNAPAGIYRNDAAAPRIAVRLKGLPPNTQGIGARIRLLGGMAQGGQPALIQSQEMICGGRYLSGDQAVRVFAAGADSGNGLAVEVRWRSGNQSVITNLQANHVYEINEAGSTPPAAIPHPAPPSPFFTDASGMLSHRHVESDFDDWARQPLLPHRVSRLGPGLSWYDYNGDGWEDLAVAGGSGGTLSVFINLGGQRFGTKPDNLTAVGDQEAVLGWADGLGNRKCLVALSNAELAPDQESRIAIYSAVKTPEKLPAGKASIGPLAAADVDGDGDLDLFVGGRANPSRYPEPASSAIWLNEQGKLRADTALSAPFQSLGMVSGATFADLDGDGSPDLALALEWGAIRVFRNVKGHFQDVTGAMGLAARTGLWTSVTAGDFDGDGKLDLAVGNWGRNTVYEINQPSPLRVYYGDWDGDGTLELMEAWQQNGNWLPIRNRRWFEAALPGLQQRFPTHEAYGRATVPEILGNLLKQSKILEAAHLESGVFLNHGSRFEWMPFPREAQMSPVFSINVGDFDGDGIEDLFLSQNFFGTSSDLSRDDAGLGLWLRGYGNGSFTAVDPSVSGIRIHGEQRAAALADFNHDGRVDLAVTQNNADTKLYINQGAKRGLRVVLKGPPANPDAVGATLRVLYADGRAGPCRSIQSGSGYLAQDAAAQVLGLAAPPIGLWIRWPGGKEQKVQLPDSGLDISVNFE